MTSHNDNADPTRRRFVQGLAATPLAYGVIAAAASTTARAQAGSPIALITGASSGFGKVSAETLARNGFHVVASMRNVAGDNATAAAELAALARTENLLIDVVEIDIDSDASVDRGMSDVMSRVGRVDVLFNNAGVSIPGPVELSMEAARRSFETNVFGQLRMLRAVGPMMREARNGLIIQMSSGLGRFVMPTSGVYSATKFAQEALFEAAAYELHPFGVEVAIIQPSDHATDIKPNSRRYFAEMMANLSPADRARADAYADHLDITERELRDTDSPPAQEVADIVLDLATTPAGQRPLRVVAMPPELAAGVNELNGQLEDVQSMILQGSGMGDWLTLAG
ncbi:MAG: SDR family NAD(P)-dependent oxidoreductase [Pseudomonadota bacterium]